MGRNIFKKSIEIGRFTDDRARLFVEFTETKDGSQSVREWTPKWDDVCELLTTAVEVERQNLPGSRYLEQFAEVCSEVVVRYAPAQDVEVLGGRVIKFRVDPSTSRALITVLYREITDRVGWTAGEATWELAVPLTENRLRDIINKEVELLVWNGKVLEVRD